MHQSQSFSDFLLFQTFGGNGFGWLLSVCAPDDFGGISILSGILNLHLNGSIRPVKKYMSLSSPPACDLQSALLYFFIFCSHFFLYIIFENWYFAPSRKRQLGETAVLNDKRYYAPDMSRSPSHEDIIRCFRIKVYKEPSSSG